MGDIDQVLISDFLKVLFQYIDIIFWGGYNLIKKRISILPLSKRQVYYLPGIVKSNPGFFI